jgi:hypothetical protein
MTKFTLSKWYADCTAETGEALILYSAELDWRGPTIHYSSLLRHQSGQTRTCFSLRKQPAPQMREGSIEWNSQAWKAEGRWLQPARQTTGMHETLFDSPAGSLEWHCLAPRAFAELRVGESKMSGWGYVETLKLSVAPWNLPIRRLRWGRFVNAADALVWIDWQGPYSRQAVYYNGKPVYARVVDEQSIVLADSEAELSLETVATLRDGLLGQTALSVFPNIDRLFPARIRNVRERKWLSRGVLRQRGKPDSAGMAIHEVVEWP